LAFGFLLAACSSAPTSNGGGAPEETGMKGIAFGMSQQAVLERLKSKDTIIETSADRIVSEGPWDVDPSIRRKTFSFQENQLQCIRYEYIKGNNALPSITPTFCK
jgi:hypothetical protein